MLNKIPDAPRSDMPYRPIRMTIFGGPVPFNYISAADIQRFFHPWTQGKVALPSKFKGMHDHGALAQAPMWIEPEDDTQNSPAPAEALGPKFMNAFLRSEHYLDPSVSQDIDAILRSTYKQVHKEAFIYKTWNNYGTASTGCPEGTQVQGIPDKYHLFLDGNTFGFIAGLHEKGKEHEAKHEKAVHEVYTAILCKLLPPNANMTKKRIIGMVAKLIGNLKR
jgi:hypothetical protein